MEMNGPKILVIHDDRKSLLSLNRIFSREFNRLKEIMEKFQDLENVF